MIIPLKLPDLIRFGGVARGRDPLSLPRVFSGRGIWPKEQWTAGRSSHVLAVVFVLGRVTGFLPLEIDLILGRIGVVNILC